MGIYELIGSKSRDAFKFWHKKKGGSYWATDIDFALVHKFYHNREKYACIAAIVDFKRRYDSLTFTEIITYNELKSYGLRVFIVESQVETKRTYCPKCEIILSSKVATEIDWDNSFKTFTIQEYITGDWKPYRKETWELKPILESGTEDDYWAWENTIRAEAEEKLIQLL